MAQQEILNLLKNKNKWLSIHYISKEINVGRISTTKFLTAMVKFNEIQREGRSIESGKALSN